jgi:hypothetical protein
MTSSSRHLAGWLLCILQVVGKTSSACRGVKGTTWDPMNVTTCGANDDGICDPYDGEGALPRMVCLLTCTWAQPAAAVQQGTILTAVAANTSGTVECTSDLLGCA